MRPLFHIVFLSTLLCCSPLKGAGDRADSAGLGTQANDGAQTAAQELSDATTRCTLYHPPDPPDASSAVPEDDAHPAAMDLVFMNSSVEFGSLPTDAGGPRHRMIGFDLDNACGDSCVEPPWADAGHHDGVEGIDNAYGQLVEAVVPNTVDVTADSGGIMLRVRNYSGAQDQDPIDVAMYFALNLPARDDGGAGPSWDGKDRWTIAPEFLIEPTDGAPPSVEEARFHADRAYVTDGSLVARFDKTLWPAGLSNARLFITARQLEIAGKLTQGGDLGAHWELQDLVVGYRVSAADALLVLGLTPNLPSPDSAPIQLYCQDKSAFDGAKQGLCAYVDISADPTKPPSAPCDGLSVGLLLQARQALLGDIGGPPEALPTCAPDVHLEMETCASLGDR